MLAVIRVALSTVKLLTVTPVPNVTVLALVKLVPVMVTSSVVPRYASSGLIEVMVGGCPTGDPPKVKLNGR